MEDLSQYWDLPNKFETDLCYIQEVDLSANGMTVNEDIYPMKTNIHQFLRENAKEIHRDVYPHYNIFKYASGLVALGGASVFALTI